MGSVAREALKKAKFVQLMELNREDPTLAFVQPVELDYWYKSWACEEVAEERAKIHRGPVKQKDLKLHNVRKYPYGDLQLGTDIYAFHDDKVVKAKVYDIKSHIMIHCIDLKTREKFVTNDQNIYELFLSGSVGYCDDQAVQVRLSRLSLLSGLESLHQAFVESNFKDPHVFEFKMLEPDAADEKYPSCDLISVQGISLSEGMLATMRNSRLCSVETKIHETYTVSFTRMDSDGNFVWYRTDRDWLFERVRFGIMCIESALRKDPGLLESMKKGVRKKMCTQGHIFLLQHNDGVMYRVGVIEVTDVNSAAVQFIDHGLEQTVPIDKLLDVSEFELPLSYILPRCVKAQVIDENNAQVVGDKLRDLVNTEVGVQSKGKIVEGQVQCLPCSDLIQVLVVGMEYIENYEVVTIQLLCEKNSRSHFGVPAQK